MLAFDLPWMFLALPLPLVVLWILPAHHERIEALRAPFFDKLVSLTGASPSRGAVVLSRGKLSWLVLVVTWLGVVAALAKPVWLGEPQTVTKSARDLMLAVDLSGSMAIEDFVDDEGSSHARLDGVKTVLDGFIKRREGDRLGLIVFGAAPFVQVPFTLDTDVTRQLLDEARVGMAGDQTALGDAIGLSVRVFSSSEASNRVLVLLTDGNDTGSLVAPLQAAQIAGQEGITVHVVGVGDPTAAGEQRLNEEVLEGIARRTGGRYFFAEDEAALEDIYAELDRLEEIEFESKTIVPRRSLFSWPLGVSVLALMLFAIVVWWRAARSLSVKGRLHARPAR
ncbi:MAG: VWA domain-containing protein [Myxococcota bacterium]